MFLHIISASYVDNYKIALKFNNGSEGIADLSESLTGKVFEPLQELLLFQQFELELGTRDITIFEGIGANRPSPTIIRYKRRAPQARTEQSAEAVAGCPVAH